MIDVELDTMFVQVVLEKMCGRCMNKIDGDICMRCK